MAERIKQLEKQLVDFISNKIQQGVSPNQLDEKLEQLESHLRQDVVEQSKYFSKDLAKV